MGKIILKIAIVCCTAFSFIYNAQIYEIEYTVYGKQKISSKLITLDLMTLYIDSKSKSSLYENSKKGHRVENSSFVDKLYQDVVDSKTKNFFDKIFKDISTQTYFMLHSVDKKLYKSDYKFPQNNWKITNNNKIILNQKCTSATINFGGRVWNVWYAPNLPFNDGPYKFSGLPGLILEVVSEDGDYRFLAQEIILQKELSKEIEIPKSIKVDENSLNKLQKDIITDPSYSLKNILTSGNYSHGSSFDGKPIKTDKAYFDNYNNDYWNWMKTHDNPIEIGDIWIK